MSEWRELRLSDFVELGKDQFKPNQAADFNYIGLEHIEQEKLRLNSVGHSSEIASNKFFFKAGDVLFGKLRPYFRKVVKAKFDGVCSTDIWVVRAKENFSQDFVFYFMANWEFIDTANAGEGGSRMPRADWNFLKNTEWIIPEYTEQKAIAAVLSSLDDKIDLLHRQNKTLEAMAASLFRQWFVEEAKADWEEVMLGEFFPVVTGKKDANYSTDDGEYPFFTCSQTAIKAPSFSFDGAAILLSGNGDFNIKRYIGKFEAYQRTYVLIPFDVKYFSFLFTLMRYYLSDITGGHQGSVINFITKGMITDFAFSMPKNRGLISKKLEQFNEIYEKVDSNTKQIRTLEKLRDTLLPKLMSGEVRVEFNAAQ